mgnify:CR=1 FL=1
MLRDFNTVFRYELKQQLGKKTVRVVTLILVVVALLATSIPRISSMISGRDDGQPQADTTLTKDVGYVFSTPQLQQEYTALLGLQQENLFPTRDALVENLRSNGLRAGFVVNDKGYEAVYMDKGVDDNQDRAFDQVMALHQKQQLLAERGLTLADVAAIESHVPVSTLTVMGKATENNILISMVLMVAVYMLVLLYGNTTSVMIAREKDSKAMELLITSTRPTPLIFGKVAAAGVSGLLQFGLIIAAVLAGFYFNQEFYDPMLRAMLVGTLSRSYVLTYLFFTVIGYILYLFLYAALGSTVSRVEDVSSATAVVQFIFIAGYVASTSVIGNPAGALAVGASLFPFTSIMVMPMRAGLMTVPAWQLILAGALMVAAVALFAWLSIKIYRWGSLNYGNKTNLFKVIGQALRHERRKAA